MTAKEKALHLFNNIAWICRDNSNYPEVAKQCALITVEEVLNSNPTWFIDQTRSTHKYWEAVRTALNALKIIANDSENKTIL